MSTECTPLAKEVWDKVVPLKVYVVIFEDPFTHSECYEGCCGQGIHYEIMGVASSKEKAEELIKRVIVAKSFYNRSDFQIEEKDLDRGTYDS